MVFFTGRKRYDLSVTFPPDPLFPPFQDILLHSRQDAWQGVCLHCPKPTEPDSGVPCIPLCQKKSGKRSALIHKWLGPDFWTPSKNSRLALDKCLAWVVTTCPAAPLNILYCNNRSLLSSDASSLSWTVWLAWSVYKKACEVMARLQLNWILKKPSWFYRPSSVLYRRRWPTVRW